MTYKSVKSVRFSVLNRTTFYKSRSKKLQCRGYLYLPRMPENHAICMQKRMKSAWSNKCGTGRTCTSRIKTAIRDLDLKCGLHTDPGKLCHFGTILNLSTVATDISMIGLYVAGTNSHQKLILLFAF